jgi:hypothetical protein
MTPQEVLREINKVMRVSIEAGLSDQQRFPAMKKVGGADYDIYIANAPDLSASMRDRAYQDVYEDLSESGAFNLRMIDGALIQMLYTFRKGVVASHRLAMFPCPYLQIYEEAQQAYEEDNIYAEIVEKSLVKFPIRFDFSAEDEKHVDVLHPKSHLTLGQYRNCRIPVVGPLGPARFMRFVIRNFYYPALDRAKFSAKSISAGFPTTITAAEREVGFFSH